MYCMRRIRAMHILMCGNTGFVGKHLAYAFMDEGWTVTPLTRSDFLLGEEEFRAKFSEVDGVVNLAGAPVMARWTDEYKKVLFESRVGVTARIVGAMGTLERKPRVFVTTSAIGIYSDTGTHTEESSSFSDGFLGKLAVEWERAGMGAAALDVRTVVFRLGVVLGAKGGALEKMLIPFKLGLGGTLGNGKQAFSWVHINDIQRAYVAALKDETFAGLYNLTAPVPTTNEGLTKALGRALRRPAVLRIPGFVLRAQYGEAAEILLRGQRVLPKRLLDAGFAFRFENVEDALADLLNESSESVR